MNNIENTLQEYRKETYELKNRLYMIGKKFDLLLYGAAVDDIKKVFRDNPELQLIDCLYVKNLQDDGDPEYVIDAIYDGINLESFEQLPHAVVNMLIIENHLNDYSQLIIKRETYL